MLACDQGVGETDETELLLSIAWGLIHTAGSDLVEADMLCLPERQGELETRTTPSLAGLRWCCPPVDNDPAHLVMRKEPVWRVVRIDQLECQLLHTRSR